FLEGILRSYLNKNMSQRNAKIKMYKETYRACMMLIKEEEDYPDHVLITTMQHALKHLNLRGSQLSKKLSTNDGDADELRKALQDLKQAKDSLELLITNYK